MSDVHLAVVGGGAAGFFAALACAETARNSKVLILEKSARFLDKVRISGGGRCNVTHACFEPRDLSRYYPRGGAALLGPFHRFQPHDTVEWFQQHGVKLKTEEDGRMFPVTDSSQTILDCLLGAAKRARVVLKAGQELVQIQRCAGGGFVLKLAQGTSLTADCVLLATGGCRGASAGHLAESLGHTLEPPVPSLFTFEVQQSWPRELSGMSLERVQVSAPDLHLREEGAVLLTHRGLSGPVILRLSAWGARAMHALGYKFKVTINWLPELTVDDVNVRLGAARKTHGARYVVNGPMPPLPARMWQRLVENAGVAPTARWAQTSRSTQHALAMALTHTELQVTGKNLNKDEFVTCGGVRLAEVDFKTMESRICPGLFFAGELLDIDGLTGGFNFQAAWTTGWMAGNSAAAKIRT